MAEGIIRANSRLQATLGPNNVAFLEHALRGIQRILPHVEVTNWAEQSWDDPGAHWVDTSRKEIRFVAAIGKKDNASSRSITASVKRRRITVGGAARGTLDTREYDICQHIALRISEVLEHPFNDSDLESLQAVRETFDESVIVRHLVKHDRLGTIVGEVFSKLHTMSEQTYENRALVFGCVLETAKKHSSQAQGSFPRSLSVAKKYKALSDGYRTAYNVSADGRVLDFWDLDILKAKKLTEKHFYPGWAAAIARVSRDGKCGIALTRQGDILVFDEGSLRFTYRYGRWQYWNHAHVVKLLRDRARAQHAPPKTLGRVVGAVYRAALDVSFRRSGGLFVILHNVNSLRDVVRLGDAIDDSDRDEIDQEFDAVIGCHKIHSLPRSVVVELASLDGAVVLANSGDVLAYGAILQPKKSGRTHGAEGSRTKAAIGASKYGLALKISSDGDITVYFGGKEFMGI
jgi:hypothetical protein